MGLQFAINVATKISNSLAGPHTVGRCVQATRSAAAGLTVERCSDRLEGAWAVAKRGCRPCRANALGALLVEALQSVKRERLEDEADAAQ